MQLGFVDRVIPSTEWVFHPYPLTLTALSIVYGSIMLYLLSPPNENCRAIGHYVDLDPYVNRNVDQDRHVETAGSGGAHSDPDMGGEARSGEAKASLADKIDNSRILAGVLALTGVVVFLGAFFTQGLGALDLNNFNFGFLMIGLLLYASPAKYLHEFYDAVQGSAGVILLFPFYAGIIRNHDRDRIGRFHDRVAALDRDTGYVRGDRMAHRGGPQRLRTLRRR